MLHVARDIEGRLDALLFDFDGVILEFAGIKTDAFRELFADHERHVDAIVALHKRHAGVNRHEKFAMIHRDILRQALSAEDDARLGRRFQELVENKVRRCPMVDGAEDVLTRFAGRIPMLVISGTPHAELAGIIETRGLDRYFAAAYGSPPGKIDLIERVLAERGFSRARVVMVGDAMTDHDAARRTGVHFIGRISPDQCEFPASTVTIDDLSGLPAAIAEQLDESSRRVD